MSGWLARRLEVADRRNQRRAEHDNDGASNEKWLRSDLSWPKFLVAAIGGSLIGRLLAALTRGLLPDVVAVMLVPVGMLVGLVLFTLWYGLRGPSPPRTR